MPRTAVLRHGSLFSGIGGFELAAARLGWRNLWSSEIEPYALKVHARRFPKCKQLGDVTRVRNVSRVDIITAGWPCQDLSVAGRRAGLVGARSGLFWEAIRVAKKRRPRWLVLENVPGLLSSHEGRDFAEVLGALVGAPVVVPPSGWPGAGVAVGPAGSVAWRILDAQHFGVPQRRRRVFFVRDSRGGGAPEVLFEPAGLRGHSAARSETRSRIAGGAVSRALARVGGGDDPGANKGAPIVVGPIPASNGRRGTPGTDEACGGQLVSGAVSSKWAKQSGGPAGDEVYNLVADPISASEGKTYTHEGKGMRTHNVVQDLGGHHTAPTLKAEGFDGMPDPGGRGLPAVFAPGSFLEAEGEVDDDIAISLDEQEEQEADQTSEPSALVGQLALFPLEGAVVRAPQNGSGHPVPTMVDAQDAEARAPTLRDGGRSAASKAGNSYDNTPVVFESRYARNGRGKPEPVAPPLKAESGSTGKGDGAPVVVGLAQITSWANRANPKPGDPSATMPASGELLAYDALNQAETTRDGIMARSLGFRPGCGMRFGCVALALQDDGWWIRQRIIWDKPNPMPESVLDRPTLSHEEILLLAKSETYFYDWLAIAEPCESGPSDLKKMEEAADRYGGKTLDAQDPRYKANNLTRIGRKRAVGIPGIRNARSVWRIATVPYAGAHFATYPPALVARCIRAGTSDGGCCPACGAPARRLTGGRERIEGKGSGNKRRRIAGAAPEEWTGDRTNGHMGSSVPWHPSRIDTLGWQLPCGHGDLPRVPCVVLDPFGGSGTTAATAVGMGRASIYVDASEKYRDLARERVGPLLCVDRVG
jgi:DNA (cytosine-5)-methyltransferase 1